MLNSSDEWRNAMKKLVKILSIILSAIMLLSVIPVTLITGFAADVPTFSLNLSEETSDYVIVSVKLENGSFTSLDIEISGLNERTGNCIYIIETDELEAFIKQTKSDGGQAISAPYASGSRGSYSIALTRPVSIDGEDIVICKFAKNTEDNITAADISLTVKSCSDGEDNAVEVKTENKLSASLPAEPQTEGGKCGENAFWLLNTETGLLTVSGSGEMYDFSENSEDSINSTAPWNDFSNSIKKVVTGEAITGIGDYAFYNCRNLESILLGSQITDIGEFAFFKCANLSQVTLDDALESIGSYAFAYCKKIDTLIIPSAVKTIDDCAFYNCSGLKTLFIPCSVVLNGRPFDRCGKINSVTVTKGSGYMPNYDSESYQLTPWYESRESLTEIKMEKGIKSVGNYSFYDNPVETIVLPDGLEYIGEFAFAKSCNLKKIDIPDSVLCICGNAFADCENLKKVNLGNSKTLTLADDAFNGCDSVESFLIGDANENYCTDGRGVLYSKDRTVLIKYPAGNNGTSYAVDSHTLHINSRAFENSVNLENIILPDGLRSLGDSAFGGCTSLESVSLPESVGTLGGYCFRDCVNLREVIFNCAECDDIENERSPFENAGSQSGGFLLDFSDSVKYIPNGLFCGDAGKYYVREITVGRSVEKTGSDFDALPSLTALNFNAECCEHISFRNCENLEDVNVGENVSEIPEYFIYGCTSVDSISIPESVKRIGMKAFEGTGYYNSAENWENNSLYIGRNLIRVDEKYSGSYAVKPDTLVVADRAFENCARVTEVSIPDSVITLGEYSFANCAKLNDVYFNAADCQFAYCAFADTGVKNFYIANDVKTLPAYLLSGSTGIKSLMIPESVDTIGEYALDVSGTLAEIVFYRNGRMNIDGPLYDYLRNYKTVVYCRENSFIHSFAEMDALPYCLFNEVNGNFKIKNDVLEYYDGESEFVYVGSASKIGYGAFEDNETVKSVELASNVTRIFSAAFKNCTNLEKIIIPASVSSIGSDAFEGCENLTVWCYAGSKAESFAVSRGIPVEYIVLMLSESSINLADGETKQLHAAFSTGLIDNENYRWISDNTSVAKVSSDGRVTAVGFGEAEITVISSNGNRAYCRVHVGVKAADGADVSIDEAAGIISGSSLVNRKADSVKDVLANRNVTVSSDSDRVGTGDRVTVYDADGNVYKEFGVVIFGDVNGDGVYDGQDSMLVNCLANGMLSKESVGDEAYMAADCNRDGVIDRLDVDLLSEAGVLLAKIEQSKNTDELMTASAAYAEYISLIDQTVEAEEIAAEETASETIGKDSASGIFDMLIKLIKSIIASFLSVFSR